MAILRVVSGRNPGQEIPLEGPQAILGRHPSCQVKLEDGSVSREHARITRQGEHYFVEDLNSRNGTLVNGELIRGRRQLAENDLLKICDLVFSFHARPGAPGGRRPQSANQATLVLDETADDSSATIMSRLDVSSSNSGLRMAVRPEVKLRALLEISENLGQALSLERILPKILDSLFKIFLQADRGFIVLRDEEGGPLIPKAVKHRRDDDDETIRISRTIVDQVLGSREAILSADAATDQRFDMSQSIADFRIRSVMCAPLLGSDNQPLGVIQIDTLDQRTRFQQDDLDVLASVARQAGFAVENAQLHERALRQERLSYDLQLAHRVQQGFLPHAAPEIDGYEFFDYYEPASELGGDYFDYIPLPGGRLAVVVADVSGKGVAASLLMAKLSSEVRYTLASEAQPARALDRLNATLAQGGWEDRFVTLVLAVIDPAAHEITVVNAGHLPPLWRQKDGRVVAVGDDEGGPPLAVDSDTRYQQLTFVLDRGEAVALCTDGISEAMNPAGELFGLERLEQELAGSFRGLADLGQRTLDAVSRFTAGRAQSDDICWLCFGRQ